MALNYSTAVKNARLQAVVDAIGAAGELVIGTAALAGTGTGVLARVPFANPSFTVAGGVMTAGALPRTITAIAAGTAAKAEFRHTDGTVVVSGLTVGTAATDIIINATAVSVGQTVQLTVGTITHAS